MPSTTKSFNKKAWPGLLLIVLASLAANCQVTIDGSHTTIRLAKALQVFVDADNIHTAASLAQADSLFQDYRSPVINIFRKGSSYWVRTVVLRNESSDRILLNMESALLDSLRVFKLGPQPEMIFEGGDKFPFNMREFKTPMFKVDLGLKKGEEASYLIWMRSEERLPVPISVGTERSVLLEQSKQDLFLGLFFGIMIVIVLYNFSIFLITGERSYFFYVLYIGFFTFTQAAFTGYGFEFLFFDYPILFNRSLAIFASLAGISAIFFAKDFLQLAHFTPRLNKGLNIFLLGYILAILFSLLDYRQLAFSFVDFTGLFVAFYGFIFSLIIARKGYRPAKFFLIAWSVFLVGLILFVLRNMGLIPHSFISNYTLQIGSAIEAVLLSIALADKINILKKDKEQSQMEALGLARENERIIREQNVLLEQKVKERTHDLENANDQLKHTLITLQNAQTQLVNAEKMASLGQLTVGIAHEINNPINFVSSNIQPLRRDIEDLLEIIHTYDSKWERLSPENQAEILSLKKQLDFEYLKEELQILLKGMEDGASRTADIVKGLRIFSRLDEFDLKKANINEGIDSTIILLKSSLSGRIHIERNYIDEVIIECYAGKLNQVFMNLLTNSIQALESMPPDTIGKIIITTRIHKDHVEVRISDNGPGMSDEVKAKVFDPFFTTKKVGQGTGLGLSIVYSIIESHKGTIDVVTAPGHGAEFIITLPKSQS